jgi:hypothetical protein
VSGHLPIAGASRSLRTLLRDRMTRSAEVTLAPPDVVPTGTAGLRVNLYLLHVQPSPHLANLPPRADPLGRVPARPPLALDLTYLLTTHAADEEDPAAEIDAQAALADALSVLHECPVLTPALRVQGAAVADAPQGAPVMDLALLEQAERLTITLQRAQLAEVTQIWSALNTSPLRRGMLLGVSVVELASRDRRPAPRPVTQRRIFLQPFRPPLIADAYRTGTPGERRLRIGEGVTIEGSNFRGGLRTLVQFGEAAAMPVVPDAEGRIATPAIPDDPALQPGTLALRVIVERAAEGVGGGAPPDRGLPVEQLPVPPAPRHLSDTTTLQLLPRVTQARILAAGGGLVQRLRVTGQRLFVPGAATLVLVGDRVAAVASPPSGTAAPTPTQVQLRLTDLADNAADLAGLPVRVRVNGAESLDVVALP